MFHKLDLLAIDVRWRMEKYLEELVQEERGAINIVEILVIIVIVIAVASIFRTSMMDLIKTVFDKIIEFVKG